MVIQNLARVAGAVALAMATALCPALAQTSGNGGKQPPTNGAKQEPPKTNGGLPKTNGGGPYGLWIDHTGRGAVEISPCARPNELCGRIVWLQQPNDKQGKPLRDILNEDKTERGKPICGLQVIGGVKKQADGSWDDGWIYDPEQGEKFDVEIRLRGPNQLQVKGYKGLKFLSETFQWQRAGDPLPPRCTTPS